MSDAPFQAGKVAVKIFIDNNPDLQAEMTHIIQSYFPNLSPADIKSNLSQNKNYVSLTYQLNVEDDSQTQLHQLYAILSKHPQVKMVL